VRPAQWFEFDMPALSEIKGIQIIGNVIFEKSKETKISPERRSGGFLV